MRTIIILGFGLIFTNVVPTPVGLPTEALAQVGSSISADGSAPNNNAMLDVQSPATGDGKGILIPRVTGNQRTNASLSVDGGLLDNSGNLRGGAAQGLMVYQTNGSEGLYFNTSQSSVPTWVYLGASTTNYLPLTGGTMSGALNMGAQIVTNVAHIDFNVTDVSVGRGANGIASGAAVGWAANGSTIGAAVGYNANGSLNGAALGYNANGSLLGVAVGEGANGYNYGAAVGRSANGSDSGAAMGYLAKGTNYGAAMGDQANGSVTGAAVGFYANGYNNGVAMGYAATGSTYGAAVGRDAKGTNNGAAMGYNANGVDYGAAVGYLAYGQNYGAAVGDSARGTNFGAAVGAYANGANSNVAIGAYANARGGTNHIAIGNNVTNNLGNDTAVIRGTLYLDGGSGIYTNTGFGSSSWTIKMFEIDHPLDPENKILRHFCLEGPQVWNVYAGNAQLKNGQAVIELPDYYSALNLVGSEIYSLTPVGALVQIAVGAKVSENRFVIIGENDVEVSWTIKVLRNDPGCLEDLRRRPVEEWKTK